MASRKWFRRLIILITLVLMAVFILPAVSANQLQEKREEQYDLSRQIEQRESRIEDARTQEKKFLEEIKKLEQNIQRIQKELNLLDTQITTTEEEIEITEAELADAEERLQEREDFLKTRIRAIYEMGQVSFLEVIFEASTFTDFLSRFNDLQRIIDQDNLLLEAVQAEREEIATQKEELEKKKDELLDMRQQSLNKKNEIEREKAKEKALLEDLKKLIAEEERLLREVEEESKRIEQMIKEMEEAIRKAEEALRRESGELQFLWPVSGYGRGWLTSPYGSRTHPITGQQGSFHSGIDIGIPHTRWPGSSSYNGSPANIVAVEDGQVIFVRNTITSARGGSGYGNYLIISHGGGITTLYAHAHRILVSNGQSVTRGQVIATVGSTGASTGPHLHFEIRKNGSHVNPLSYY